MKSICSGNIRLSVMLAGALLLSSCSPLNLAKPVLAADQPRHNQLSVFAAASLTAAFDELGALFEARNPQVTIVFNFAGSQQLAAQIGQGAPADVFASADLEQIQSAIASERITTGEAQIMAYNSLVIIYPASNSAQIYNLSDLARPGLKIALADAAVPVGRYALEFLDKATPEYRQAVLNNVVSYEENVTAVLNKVLLDEVDAGIVYTSDTSGGIGQQVGQITIPERLNVRASYAIAPLKDSAQPDLAQAFIEFVLSPVGQAILQKYGFQPVQ